MNDFLQQLLEHELDNRHLISVKPPAIKSGWSASAPATTRSAPPLGLDFLDRLNDLEGEMSDYERLACFRHGFRLAGRLLMELLP